MLPLAILAAPAVAQTGSITYQVHSGGVSTITVDYTNRTVTTVDDSGFAFTQVDGPDFDFIAAAAVYAQLYGQHSLPPPPRG